MDYGFDNAWKAIAQIDSLVAEKLFEYGYDRMGPPSDRHSTLELAFVSHSGKLNRFVMFSLTPLAGDAPASRLQIEAGVDIGDRYHVEPVIKPRKYLLPSEESELLKLVTKNLEGAMERAERLLKKDMHSKRRLRKRQDTSSVYLD